jgi:tetratricopeptide (TPR) repeat protein
MISDLTSHRVLKSPAIRCVTAMALFLCALLGVSAALAHHDFYYGTPDTSAPTLFGAPAPAAGGSADLKTCDKGLVWDAKKKKCIVKRSGVLPDSDLIEYAYALANAERYQEAIDILDALQDPGTARALNYRGYVTRKMGRTEEGIAYYLQSISLDPQYAQVREYLGEAYVIQGKLDLAKQQLEMIGKICGSTECEEYEDLADAIRQAHGT